jgi:hypothetical protein
MKPRDSFCQVYEEWLEASYDCVDRIVLNAYFGFAPSTGGFRT